MDAAGVDYLGEERYFSPDSYANFNVHYDDGDEQLDEHRQKLAAQAMPEYALAEIGPVSSSSADEEKEGDE